MRAFILTLAAVPAVLATAVPTACNENNCFRDVQGTRSGKQPIATRQADCSNFMTTTVYATPTATAAPSIVYNRKMKRDPVTVSGAMPAYVSQCANKAAYASVCSCWGYTSTVITVTTPTTTVTPQPVCTKGVEYAYYALTQGDGHGQVPVNSGGGSNYHQKIDTGNFRDLTPFSQGKSKRVSYGSAQCGSGSTAVVDGVDMGPGSHADYSVLQHRGYLAADQAGDYILTIYGDEFVMAWFGAKAVSGWTTANADVISNVGQPVGTFTLTAAAGSYTPFRIFYANAQGCFQLSVKLQKPDGTVILSNTGDVDSQNVLTGCGGVLASSAPAFAPFGTDF